MHMCIAFWHIYLLFVIQCLMLYRHWNYCSDHQSVCDDDSNGGKCTRSVAGRELVCNARSAGGTESTRSNQPARTVVDVPNTTNCSFRSASDPADAWNRMAAFGHWCCRHSVSAATAASASCSAKFLCTDGRRAVSTESKPVSMKCVSCVARINQQWNATSALISIFLCTRLSSANCTLLMAHLCANNL